MSKLVVFTKKGIKISEYPVVSAITIGRAPANDVQINNPGVSARHARVIIQHEQFVLEDLGSRNGTYVNLDRITRKVLENGDTINFPNCKLKFIVDDDDDEAYDDFESWWRSRKTERSEKIAS